MSSTPSAAALFARAVQTIQNLPPATGSDAGLAPSNAEKLQFYSLYKQATQGDIPKTAKRPSLWDPVGRAKWDAWAARKGTSQEDAMREYVDAFLGFLRRFPDRPQALELLESFLPARRALEEPTTDEEEGSEAESEEGDEEEEREPDFVPRTSSPSPPSAAFLRRASIATAGGGATSDDPDYFSATESASDIDDDEDDRDIRPFSPPIGPGPHPHSSAFTGSRRAANDDARSVTSVSTVRPPPHGAASPARRPTVIGPVAGTEAPTAAAAAGTQDMSASWVVTQLPAAAAASASPELKPTTAAVTSSATPAAAAASAEVAQLRAQIAKLQSLLNTTTAAQSRAAAARPSPPVLALIRAVARWTWHAAVVAAVLAAIARSLKKRAHPAYKWIEWIVLAAVGARA
ncbi:Acyl-CoA binding domain containing 5 [Blastocladiella emersonii ATCC 22665]|nr:Acyl-CoA binding domain containing 5 [Blastocladiella emersonii ATCC 22665]